MNTLEQEAILLYQQGDLIGAANRFEQLLQIQPNNSDTWLNLAVIYLSLGNLENAQNSVLNSLEINAEKPVYHYTLGLIFEQKGDIINAAQAYQNTIDLDADFIDAYNNLGNILFNDGKIDLAESFYRQAIAINPQHLGSYLNLGNLLLSQQSLEEAISIYETALKLYTDHPDIVNNLNFALQLKNDHNLALIYFGNELYKQGKYQESIHKLEELLTTEIGEINVYLTLAECYQKLQQYPSAINSYYQGITYYPEIPNLYYHLIAVLRETGETEQAIAIANQALSLFPDDLYFYFLQFLTLPIIYQSEEEIKDYRKQFTTGLEILIETLDVNNPDDIEKAFTCISQHSNFFLAYQCENDRELQKKYGKFVHQVMSVKYPQWVKPLKKRHKQGEKIKIGYVSMFLKDHPGAKWVLGWLKNHPKQQFEIYCYYINQHPDFVTLEFQKYSDKFYHIYGNLEAVCQQIFNDQLDILVYPDLGMNPQATLMAALRLSPVQCTGWGHPVTSGLSTIDYYLSCELMETEESHQHYLEQLICLPKIGLCYPQPSPPETIKNRSEFGLNDNNIMFLCSQMLAKYLPQYDYIFAEIVVKIPLAKFIFIARPNQDIVHKFKQRLQKTFITYNLSIKDYFIFVPPQDYTGYISLNIISDIFLDSFDWSGGNTTLDAIACSLPVVTCAGKYMRGRHSYAFLTMLEVTETIAKNPQEYLEIAINLGLNKLWREQIKEKMQKNHHLLYNDLTSVKGLNQFFQNVVKT
jgi:protein O-GlcNAc transferase